MRKNLPDKEDWKENLSDDEYRVMRCSGTEPAFSGIYYNHKGDGIYKCKACGNNLFSSEIKFNSGTGWPSTLSGI